ncbi:MAG: hypothetical protein ACI9BH_002535 [Paracoccaceae bacterium]
MVVVPNIIGMDDKGLATTYHAFFNPVEGIRPTSSDGRPVYEGLRPDFV